MPTFAIDWIAAAGVLPLVIFRRTRVDPALGRLSDAITVRPSRRTAACSRSGVTLLAICTTTSSWIRRVSVAGGISTTLRSRPGRICRPPAAEPAPGAPARRLRRRLDGALDVADHGRSAERGELGEGGETQDDLRLLRPPRDCRNYRRASDEAVPSGAAAGMPVLTKKHSASLQFPTIDGNAGGREAEVGSFDAMNGPVVLPGPPVALPEADELVMLPDGKLDAGIDPGREVDEAGIGAGEAADRAEGAAGGRRRRRTSMMLPKLAPTKPPTMSRLPVPVTLAPGVVNEAAMVPRFTPANPPR